MSEPRPRAKGLDRPVVPQAELALHELLEDYERYCLSENADPEAYVARIRELLEQLKSTSGHDTVAIAAHEAFLEIVSMEEEQTGA
jgi:hypothetical protein